MINSGPVSEDAAGNRAGQLSTRQRQGLVSNVRSSGCVGVVLFGFALMMLVFMADALVPPQGQRFHMGALLLAGFWGLWALGLGGGAVWAAYRLVTTWLDLSEGRVEQGRGAVAWHGGRYRAQVQGRWLATSDMSLGPGDYQLYYLPRTGRVLSAERLDMESASQVERQVLATLAHANRFNIDALTNYRAGHLGDERWSILGRAWLTSGLASLFMVAMSVTMVAVNLSDRSPSGGTWVVVVIAGVILFMALGVFWRLVLVVQDVLAGRVASQTGLVQRVARSDRRRVSYYYLLGKLTFTVSESAYNALVEGRHYRVYYLPRSSRLVAVEPMD